MKKFLLFLPLLFIQFNCTSFACDIQEAKEVNQLPIIEFKNNAKEKIDSPSQDESSEPSKLKGWISGDYATGNWGGIRNHLEEHGISVSGSYTNDNFMKLHGGLNKKYPITYLGLVDTSVDIDTHKLGLWKGGHLNVHFQNLHGKGLTNKYVGDIQVFDNADGKAFTQLSEYWYEQSLFKDRFKLKAGKEDANNDFANFNSGMNFIHSSYGFMPIIPLPSYPEQAMGLVATIKPIDCITVKSGWFDGDGRGGQTGFNTAFSGKSSSLFLEQVGISHKIKNHPGNYFAGYWLKTAKTEELTNESEPQLFAQNTGMYAVAEQMIFKENKKDSEDNQGLTIFGQFAWAHLTEMNYLNILELVANIKV